MKKVYLWMVLLLFIGCTQEKFIQKTKTEGKYTYEYVTHDPTETRIYTLDNGLKVYLSRYENAPRISVNIAVKAGGKNDPADNTGLAHYLEHMMFKGTSQFGTLDYESEKPLLDEIETAFNTYATLTDTEERKALYRTIDSLSNIAATFAIPNEYDKMISAIGGKGLNAYTTEDRTVYTVDIPSNALARFLTIEGVRFSEIVNRLFHTELEAVYEEKNRGLDNDYWKLYEALYENLFSKHPYGTQTVIGTVDHLKNPSITAIKDYFNQYYRPNNIAICMSGELDYAETIALIDEHFGGWEPNPELAVWEKVEEVPIETPIIDEVFGPQQERVFIGYRFDGTMSDDFLKVNLIDMLLANSTAGLIDLNLVQQQKVLSASCFVSDMNDYSIHVFNGTAKEGQTLEEVQALMLEQVEKVKAGEFEDWMLEAVINDLKKNEMQQDESPYANEYRVDKMVLAFTNNTPWTAYVDYYNQLSSITKAELVAFAKAHYQDNYAVIYKRGGEDPNIKKVEKPEITKVPLNREQTSEFQQTVFAGDLEKLVPKFLNFDEEIQQYEVQNVEVIAKENTDNELFRLQYIYEFGNNADPKFGLALSGYMDYIGADSLSATALKQEYYKLGADFSVGLSSEQDRMYITLTGLSDTMEASLALFERMLQNPVGTQEAYDKLAARMIKSRTEAKKNKRQILFTGLQNYVKYGADNPATHLVNNALLTTIKSDEMTKIIQSINHYPHRIAYYGNKPESEVKDLLSTYHKVPDSFKEIPPTKTFEELDYETPGVFWSHYDMVQTEIVLLSKGALLDNAKTAAIRLYNEYFGGGMNSIVFQEIREAQGLAYSVFSQYGQAYKKDRSDYLFSYIGIQADKQVEALAAMFSLLNSMPQSETAFEIAKEAILSKIESERITKFGVLNAYFSAEDRGLDVDIRETVYQEVKNMKFDDLMAFHEAFVKDKQHHILLIGHRDKINKKNLAKYGKVTEIALDDLFVK